MTKKLLIVGATSAMAQATARLYASEDSSFVLAGRSVSKLEEVKSDLLARGAKEVFVISTDTDESRNNAQKLIQEADLLLGSIDITLLAYGYLGVQTIAESDSLEAEKIMHVNYNSAVFYLLEMARYFSSRKSGSIVCISSVAGDRGRKSNFVYGSAKGGLSIFLQGLRQKLSKDKVNVITVKPGFVRSPMTSHLKQGFLFADPHVVGQGIKYAIEKNKSVVYLPSFWRYILLLIRIIPEFLFRRL